MWRTNRPTDQLTHEWTDKAECRVARRKRFLVKEMSLREFREMTKSWFDIFINIHLSQWDDFFIQNSYLRNSFKGDQAGSCILTHLAMRANFRKHSLFASVVSKSFLVYVRWFTGALRQMYCKIDEVSSSWVSPDQSGSQSNGELRDPYGKPTETRENNILSRTEMNR